LYHFMLEPGSSARDRAACDTTTRRFLTAYKLSPYFMTEDQQ